MSKEHVVPEPYWNADEQIGIFRLGTQDLDLRLQAHVAPESYQAFGHEPIALPRRGERVYVQGKAYILLPDYRLTIALDPSARPGGPIGNVVSSELAGMRQRIVGHMQAWHYPSKNAVVIWECFLDQLRAAPEPDPFEPNLLALWQGVECFLRARFPTATELVTPQAEPLYDISFYQRFLARLGYRPISSRAFGKRIQHAG